MVRLLLRVSCAPDIIIQATSVFVYSVVCCSHCWLTVHMARSQAPLPSVFCTLEKHGFFQSAKNAGQWSLGTRLHMAVLLNYLLKAVTLGLCIN